MVPLQTGQTNEKLGLFHRTIEEEIWHYESLPEYIEYYNGGGSTFRWA